MNIFESLLGRIWFFCSAHRRKYLSLSVQWGFCCCCCLFVCLFFFPSKSRPIWTIVVYSSGKLVLYPASYSNACEKVNCYESPLNTENVPSSNSVVGDSLSSGTVVSQLSFFQQRIEGSIHTWRQPTAIAHGKEISFIPAWCSNEIHSSRLDCVTANKGVSRCDWLIHE